LISKRHRATLDVAAALNETVPVMLFGRFV
jgi:hypothetical protein